MITDFSDCPLTRRMFGGTERKIGVMIKGSEYLLKFQRNGFPMNNHISEHIGSTVFSLVGIESQRTHLGTYDGANVVACRVFTDGGCQFVPFDDISERSIDCGPERTDYDYDDIMSLLRTNRKLTNVESTVEAFWDIFIIDGLIGNFDRHGRNWGFLKRGNRYELAPVFDNGSCLYPRMTSEEEMLDIISSEERTDERIFGYPTSQIRLDGKKSSYHDVISSMRFDECNRALLRMYPRIDMPRIETFIDGIEQISEIQKAFYKHMLRARYDRIIASSYRRLKDR